MRSPRLWAALAAFSLIGGLAATTLEGKYRQAVLIVIFGLAARCGIAYLAASHTPEPPATQTPEQP
ncbi:MAG: hypothetical protein K2X03_27135 [Bryobacteraceae bacterium]|nr:hypothetical protein [Bryobacteraceae bacterium]